MPIWTQFVEPVAVRSAGQVFTPGFMPSSALSTGLITGSGGRLGAPPMSPTSPMSPISPRMPLSPTGPAAPPAPTCTLPQNPNYGQQGVNDPYFSSQAEHDTWAAANGGCPIPPYTPDSPPSPTPLPTPPTSTLAPAPTLVSPPDAASVPAGPVIFKWTADPTAKTSNVRVCSGPNGTGTCNTTAANAGDTSVSIPLTAGAYYWSMDSIDADGTTGPWSADRTITVTSASSQPPPAQTPPAASTEPSLGTIAVIVGLSATVIWLLYQQTMQTETGRSGSKNKLRIASSSRRTERTRL